MGGTSLARCQRVTSLWQTDRMGEAALRRTDAAWLAIDYAPAPPDRFVGPEDHWPALAAVPMTLAQRLAMTSLALRFSCEMVAHFEEYVVRWLEQHRSRLHGALSDRAARRFADDERNHIAGFRRLLAA